ncbi:MAG: hypothetical protein GXY49_00930 [Syntrophomonadaceae bacterium]|nr:hypothetical protein [Syntrophomonadaceae bacterium]
MKRNEIKIALILLALLLTLGVLLGGQKLYHANMVEKPIIKELHALSYVESAAISKTDGIYQIKVHIRQPGNLKNEYQEIDKIIAAKIKKRPYEIKIGDRRDAFLQNQLQKMELSLYEALAQNSYLDLEQRFADTAARDHFIYRLQIDQQRLYVQISRGDKFLYEIIERNDADKVAGEKKE